jgi:hypothetical protein
MAFLDKNLLEQALDGDAVEEEDDWEHRGITSLIWEARKGWKVLLDILFSQHAQRKKFTTIMKKDK